MFLKITYYVVASDNLQIILQNGKEDGDSVYSKKASDDPVLHTYFAFNVESIPPLIYMQKI